ncbi:hypothetical protein BCR35DRAFT_335283 [Leucosporidium creatinivorum]|uniref:C2H2-type domain-containing protein n=1 Tax=Leucosporidium creatinivorum TaxID=106004 RepID=A0A1Y2DEJ9_9BASI|nr:hypothetical protein BCR35DRAFT_335283 [Leucosporidium creatinivorum]
MPRRYDYYGRPICDQCGVCCNNDNALDSHLMNSYGHSWCQTCDIIFASDQARRSHWANSTIHNFCTLCDTHYNSPQDLHAHQNVDHSRCTAAGCSMIFREEVGLHEHCRQSHSHLYCVECRRLFRTQNEWTAHRNSSLHRPATVPCPSTRFGGNCTRMFGSLGDATLHLEAGTCSSGMDRMGVDRFVVGHDRTSVVTNPQAQRLIGYINNSNAPPPPQHQVTSDAWSPADQAFFCVLCPPRPRPRLFKTANALNQHLNSSVHVYSNQDYADKLYRCPSQECRQQFALFSALVSHLERGSCFQQLQRVQQTIGW